MRIKTNIKAGASMYKLQENDTLASLARIAYGPNITAEDTIRIYAANPQTLGVDPCHFTVGAEVLLPDRPVQPYQPVNPYIPPTPYPKPHPIRPKPPKPDPVVGACTEHWGNGVCLFKECPYPPFQMPC